MNLITSIAIENVRSIQNAEINNTEQLHILVGKNSSGKSNTLRALNLFFNGHIEPGKEIDFQRDHYEQHPRLKKKKRITVSVGFDLPKTFKFRKGIEHIEPLLTNRFVVKRIWELNQLRQPVDRFEIYVANKLIVDGDSVARQFLSLITYRYIPNRSVPSEILKDESQDIANLIFGRMKGDKHAAALLDALSSTAERILEGASDSMTISGSPLSNPSIATADSIGEMLVMSGFQAKGEHGLQVQDEDWGAGHQAFFLYQVLCALDTSYGRFFGWKQATVWGVEEPEAGLHKDLESRLAAQFREWCDDEGYKLQMFITTHSSIFTMAAKSGCWVELKDGESEYESQSIQDLTYASEIRGVTEWVHPVLYFPWNPVVLVEGKYDVEALNHAAKLLRKDYIKFVSVPDLDNEEKRGGDKKMKSFLVRSKAMIKNRHSSAPFLVLFDWDVSDADVKAAVKAYGDDGGKNVTKMMEEDANPMLSSDFKGIERYYPVSIIEEAHHADEITVGIKPGKPFSVSQKQLNDGKYHLSMRLKDVDDIGNLTHLTKIVEQVDKIILEKR